MDPTKTLIFLIIATNAGGEGKTVLARLMKALWQLGNESAYLFCGDPGNRAAKVADNSAGTLGWGVQAMRAPDIVAATAGQNVIIDFGAMGKPIEGAVNEAGAPRAVVGVIIAALVLLPSGKRRGSTRRFSKPASDEPESRPRLGVGHYRAYDPGGRGSVVDGCRPYRIGA